jgi:hypothetical protein
VAAGLTAPVLPSGLTALLSQGSAVALFFYACLIRLISSIVSGSTFLISKMIIIDSNSFACASLSVLVMSFTISFYLPFCTLIGYGYIIAYLFRVVNSKLQIFLFILYLCQTLLRRFGVFV